MLVSDGASSGRCAAVTRIPCGNALLKGRYRTLLQEHTDGDTVPPLLRLGHELRHLAEGHRIVSPLRDDRIIPFLFHLVHTRLAMCQILAGEPVLGMQIV